MSLNRTVRRILAPFTVALLALALTLLLSSVRPAGGSAHALFQASPLDSPVSSPSPTLTPGILLEPPTLEPPTSVPLPAPIGPTPTPKGFLPAPTIVNPEDVKSLPLAQPPVSSSGAAAEPANTPAAPAARDGGLRAAVELLNYLWLLCGAVLLIGGAVAILLLWRRRQRS